MRKTDIFLFFIFLSFCCRPVYPQNRTENSTNQLEKIDSSILECEVLASSDPAEAKKRLSELKIYSEKNNYPKGTLRISRVLMLLYYNDGDYQKVIEETNFIEKSAKAQNNYDYLADVYRMRGNAYGEMKLPKEALKELDKALPYIDKIKIEHVRHYKKALIYESYAGIYAKEENNDKELYYRHKSILESEKMSEVNQLTVNAKYQNIACQYSSMALIFANLNQEDSANYYFEATFKIIENDNEYEIYDNVRATLLSDMAKFYDANKEYHKAISFAKRAEEIEKQLSMPYIRKDIYHSLFNSYIETNKKDSSKYYLKLYTSLNDSLMKSERESIMTPAKQIIFDRDKENRKKIKNLLISGGSLFVILLLVGGFLWIRNKRKLKNEYEKLINKLKNESSIKTTASSNIQETEEYEDTENESDSNEKCSQITENTIQTVLSGLEKFEKSDKYLKKEISLSYLASQLGTNTKYLSEIINQHKAKSFSRYINGLRINYIVTLLYNEPKYREYKISYLAKMCGFSSREVFAVVFKKETGVSPSYYIENLKKDNFN